MVKNLKLEKVNEAYSLHSSFTFQYYNELVIYLLIYLFTYLLIYFYLLIIYLSVCLFIYL